MRKRLQGIIIGADKDADTSPNLSRAMTTTKILETTAPAETPLLTDVQVRRLIQLPDRRHRQGRRNAALLAILAGGGLRIGEAMALRLQDVERGPKGTVVLRFKTAKRKDGSRRAVVLAGRFARPVIEYLAHADLRFWLLPGRRNEHLSVRTAQRIVMGYLARLGRADFRVHDLRHQATTMMLRASGGDVWSVARMMGWKNLKQLQDTYSHYLDQDAHRIAQQLDDHLKRNLGRGAA